MYIDQSIGMRVEIHLFVLVLKLRRWFETFI